MSKSKITPEELLRKIYDEVGDPGGLAIYFVRTDEGGWFAEARSGSKPIPASGFQALVDRIAAGLRSQYDLCPYSDVPPMHAEEARRRARFAFPPGHYMRDRFWEYARQAGVGPHAPAWVYYRRFEKEK